VLINHKNECFFFREGYIRTSSSEYSTDDAKLEDGWVHLTNNAIQKNAPNYQMFEDGNQLSFPDFKRYLRQHHNKQGDFFERVILSKMRLYTMISLQAVKKKLNSSRRIHCFEIFGYDFIIDNDFNTFLIEANTNPCLEESS